LKTSHITIAFFKQCEALTLSLEKQDLVRFKKKLGIMGAAGDVKSREDSCFSLIVIDVSFRRNASRVRASGDSRIN
jgi:hypothetical protein